MRIVRNRWREERGGTSQQLFLAVCVWLAGTIQPTPNSAMNPRFAFALIFIFALPGSLFAQTAEDFYKKGSKENKSGMTDAAIADFGQAIALNPNYAKAYLGRGNAKADKKDFDGAIADCDRAIALDPKYIHAYAARGYAKAQIRDFDGAIADDNQAIALDPSYAHAYRNRGNAKMGKKDFDGALADFDQAIALSPHEANIYGYRGNAKLAKKDFAGAIKDYDRVIAMNPLNLYAADAYCNRGVAKNSTGDLDGAIADYVWAITLNPNEVDPYINRGNLKLAKKDFYGAIADYDHAILLDPTSKLARDNRSIAEKAMGNGAGQDNVAQSMPPPPNLSDIDPEPDLPARVISAPAFPRELLHTIVREMAIWGQAGGTVQVGFVVDSDGRVHNPFVISSTEPSLDQAAIDSVSKALCTPARHHGIAVNTYAETRMGFSANVGSKAAEMPDSKIKQRKLPSELQYDTPPKLVNNVVAVYPFELLRDDRKGNAQVGFFVSPTGKVEQAVVLKDTRPEFGFALLAMLGEWKFQPAMKDGKPSWAVMDITQKFSRSGGDVPVSDEALDLLRELKKDKPALCPINELDAQPKLLSQHPPVFPSSILGTEAEGQAVVEFFIDHDGNVQLPRVVSATAAVFGYSAVQSVATWKFTPPTSHGQPVDIRVQIPIQFNPPMSAATAPPSAQN
jgi:TonB family protein